MNKLIKSLAVIGVALTAFSTTTTHASAKHHYVTTPTTLRGRWYSLNKAHETLNITKYTIQNGTWKLSGKKFFKGINGPELYIGKNKSPHSYYWFSRNGTDAAAQFRKVTIKIKGTKYTALKERTLIDYYPLQYKMTYWTHHKDLKR
ncbi:hypothetical protein [Secundilactobacillus silagei]|uniref:Uncharacterized protein n=2 Tax=Secundilactobacillus silagei TaxID=1293415 RepID=A0A1Z5IIF8_9LACO|nr:hypothetical protein [Secundilactobacillus silagei]TDG72912.1 hypothetical protein C5L25_002201 [Secundilactobacillus silagei JCM 19001]GAX01564.1 hypothetical protein IWT126_01606 [Secundilactobacillus silagei JCM 19001]